MILCIWETMQELLMETGLLKPYTNTHAKQSNGFLNRAVLWSSWHATQLRQKHCERSSNRILSNEEPISRVLGVIRPTTEIIGHFSKTNQVGVLATSGTVQSDSYPIEIQKFFPEIRIFQQECPMWVPLIENNEHGYPGADYFVKEYLDQLFSRSKDIDTLLLGCTHYPLLKEKIGNYISKGIKIVSQGEIVAESLKGYLDRHPEMEIRCSKNGELHFYTTDSTVDFDRHASIFYGKTLFSKHIELSPWGDS